MVEDHWSRHSSRAPTSTLRLHRVVLVSRVPISRQRVSWYLGGNTPRIMLNNRASKPYRGQ